jgi:hypothetical protein
MRFTHLCNTILLAIAVTHVGAAPTSNALGSPTTPQNGSLDARSWSWGSRNSRPPMDLQVQERDARSASYEHLPSWTQAQSISARQLNKRTLIQRNDRPLHLDEDSSDDTGAMRTGSGSCSSYEPEPPHGPEADPPHDRMQRSEPDGPLSQRGDGDDNDDDANPADELDDPLSSADVTSDTSGPQSELESESSLSRRDDDDDNDGEDTAPADELDDDGSSPADASSDASSDTSDAPATNVQTMSAPADQSGSDAAAATSGTNSTSDSGDTQPAAPGADANADDADGSTSASSDGVQATSASSTTPTDSSDSIPDSSTNLDAGSETAAPDSESSEGATDANADDSSPSDGTIAGSELLRCRNVGRDALCED